MDSNVFFEYFYLYLLNQQGSVRKGQNSVIFYEQKG